MLELKQWMTKHERGIKYVADKLEVKYLDVWRWLNKEVKPRKKNLVKILKLIKG